MLYLLLKWLHVLAAIVAIGANVTYGIWIARASRNPDVLPFTLRGIKLIDDRIANPAYGVTHYRSYDGIQPPAFPDHPLAAHRLSLIRARCAGRPVRVHPHPAAADRSIGPRRLRLTHLPSSGASRDDARHNVGGPNHRHCLSNGSETKPMGVTLQR
jgi:hypothetical protein